MSLPPLPLDDVTLLAIEHALDASLTYEQPEGAEGDGPWVVGADYTLPSLLDFLAGVTGRDPSEVLIQEGRDESDLPEWERNPIAAAEIVYDTRPHYSEHDLIRALVAEVRRLRSEEDR